MPECRTFRRGISFEQRSFEFAAAVDYALTPGAAASGAPAAAIEA